MGREIGRSAGVLMLSLNFVKTESESIISTHGEVPTF